MDLKKELGSVAEAVKKVMEADLSPKQKQIAKMSEPKHKIDAGDLAKLRAGHKPVKEEVKQIDELKKSTLGSYVKKAAKSQADHSFDHGEDEHRQYGDPEDTEREKDMKDRERAIANREKGIGRAVKRLTKEDTIDEASYSAKAARAGKDIGKPGKMFGKIAASAAKKYGSEERGKKVAGAVLAKLRMKEDEDFDITDEQAEQLLEAYQYDEENKLTFSEMLSIYKEHGLSSIVEEPTEDEFNREIKDQMDSFLGKKKQPKVSAPATKGVKDMPESVEIEERSLTEPEMKKKEEIVKSMKKKMPGFKERYGERAKSVMYATATKMAKKD